MTGDRKHPTGPQALGAHTPDAALKAKPGLFSNLRGDVLGGLGAAVLTIPISMGYGALALAPLGPDYVAQGVLAGLYAPIFGCLVALLLGARTTLIYAPRSIVTFLIGSLLLSNLMHSELPALQGVPASQLLALLMLMIAGAGLFQVLFGALRLGSLVRYLPAPVLAGFQNAAALLILASQLPALLGLGGGMRPWELALHLDRVQPLTLAVGFVCCVIILNGSRITKRLPPPILGLLCGLALYHGLALAGLGAHLGPQIGAIPDDLPSPRFVDDFVALLSDQRLWTVWPSLLLASASLAIVASLDSVLCARLVSSESEQLVRNNAELVRLGLGNAVSACFGGIANGVNLASSYANHRGGARTSLSLLVHAGVILLLVVAFSPAIAVLPRVVIAALLTVVAIQLFDRWTLSILWRLLRGRLAGTRSMLVDLGISAVVTVVAVAVDIVAAVGTGILIAVAVFLRRMSKSVVRRVVRGDAVHSRRTRVSPATDILAAHGAEIVVLELQGPVFFGTAENLADAVERTVGADVRTLVLDLQRVNEIDSTGAKVILQIHQRLRRERKHLLLCGVDRGKPLGAVLHDMGVGAVLSGNRVFDDADQALEWAEDQLIAGYNQSPSPGPSQGADSEDEGLAGLSLHDLEAFAQLSDEQLAVIQGLVERRRYAPGEIVFSEGDPGDALYVVLRGSASVRLHPPGQDRETRLTAFSAGTVFGEIALLDRALRSATVRADDALVCCVLPRAAFEMLTEQHPAIAIRLLTNLAQVMSRTVRRNSQTIAQLSA